MDIESLSKEELLTRNNHLLKLAKLLEEDEEYLKKEIEKFLQPYIIESTELEDKIADLKTQITTTELENKNLKEKLIKLQKQDKERKALQNEMKRMLKEKQKYDNHASIIRSYGSGTISHKQIPGFNSIQ